MQAQANENDVHPARHDRDLQPGHLPALDGLRGMAIILVLIVHLTFSSFAHTNSFLITVAASLCQFGWVGVDLFFVLSGFLITGILYETLGRPFYFRNFYARRFLRIFPLYYGAIIALLFLSRPLGIAWHGSQFILLSYLQNTPPWIHRVPASVHRYTAHFWSLAVEEQFYLVWPCIVFLIRSRRKLVVTALLLGAIAPVARIGILMSPGIDRELCLQFTLCRIDSLLIGSAFALAIRGPARSALLRIAPATFLMMFPACAAVNLFLYGNLDPRRGDFFNSVGYTLLAVSFAALIGWALRPRSLADRVFRNSTLRWFGKYSYGIYVLHFICANVDVIWGTPHRFLAAHFHSKVVPVALGGIPTLIISVALAWLSYRFYETPFLRLKRYFGGSG
jgi:peptidoglycan/LPS O-acetylase OafA/YrhL